MASTCLAVVMSMVTAASLIRAAEPTPMLYAKKDTWTETMLAARETVSRIQEEQSRRPAATGVQPFVSQTLQGTGPGQQVSVKVAGCHWLRLVSVVKSGGGNCHIWGDARLIAADGTVTWLGDLQPAAIRVGWGNCSSTRTGRTIRCASANASSSAGSGATPTVTSCTTSAAGTSDSRRGSEWMRTAPGNGGIQGSLRPDRSTSSRLGKRSPRLSGACPVARARRRPRPRAELADRGETSANRRHDRAGTGPRRSGGNGPGQATRRLAEDRRTGRRSPLVGPVREGVPLAASAGRCWIACGSPTCGGF